MFITLNWLKDFIEIKESPEQLAEILTNVGLEVDSVRPVAPGLGDDVIVSKILSIKEHPNASRLVLCDVTDGTTNYDIVCGAKNMKAGDIVALAKTGSVLPKTAKFPDGIKIEKTKIRGEVSEGMLCADNELGIGSEGDGILILNQYNPKLGTPLIKALDLDDFIFEISITPNRPDCLSVLGVARQLSAVLGRKMKYPESKYELFDVGSGPGLTVQVADCDKCPRYTGRYIDNIVIRKSPRWMRQRLEACGVRAINNVVDITNYVMLEYGHPLHAFDARYLEGQGIVVRPALEREKMTTLDGIEREFCAEDLLICDYEKPVAIAGVMGGQNSEVTEDTSSVVLECAYFDPISVRKTSKRLKLSTESSYRFERGLDPNSIQRVVERTSALLSHLASGRVYRDIVDVYPKVIEPVSVTLDTKYLNSLIGIKLSSAKVKNILGAMGVEIKDSRGSVLECTVPTYRVDLTREIDLIEDISIVHGYNSVPVTLPNVSVRSAEDSRSNFKSIREIKKLIALQGYSEVINYSFSDLKSLSMFSDTKAIDILNPLTTEQSAMRTSVVQSVLSNLIYNVKNQADDIKLFEIARTYEKTPAGIVEKQKLCVVSSVKQQSSLWNKRDFDFYDLKNLISNLMTHLGLINRFSVEQTGADLIFLHPGKSAAILVDGNTAGYMGFLHPDYLARLDLSSDAVVMEIDLDLLLKLQLGGAKFTAIPRFPHTTRDLSLVVDSSVSAATIINEIEKVDNELIEDVSIVDVYSGGDLAGSGKKSVSVSLVLRAKDKTLTDEQANLVQSSIFDKLSESLNAHMRS